MQSLSLSEYNDNTVRYALPNKTNRTVSRIDNIPENRSVLKIRFGSNNQDAKGWLDWFEILYRRHFEAVNDILIFTSPDTTGLVAYTLSNFSSREILAFDVTDHSNVKRITQLTFDPIDPTICKLQLPQVAGSIREMAAVGQNGLSIPSIAIKVENSTLHYPNNAFDFIIISPKEFLSEANRLKSHRESKDNLSTIVVDIAHIYNEFSGGLLDPIAIRDFLKYAQTYWTKSPQYVLLFGWGHYDYKNITTSLQNWIPPYETMESINQDDSYTTDDSLVILYPNNSSSIYGV